ncbi:MAG: hypothetical protein KBS64_04890, partial [Treponema sp.]|nr:hypothetical protein [Candidatus Treponema equi]
MFNSNLMLTAGMDYLLYLQNLRETIPDWITDLLFYFSDFSAGVAALIVIAVIYWSINKRQGSYMLVSYSSAIFINNMIKAAACVYRPWVLNSDIHLAPVAVSTATGYSFPSG